MSAFLSGIWSKLLVAGAIVLGLLLLVGKLMGAGRAQERADQAERNNQLRRQADDARNDVDAAGEPELDRLRDKWTRN